jgi:tetrapyrrole methylase family protein/MazG family protein
MLEEAYEYVHAVKDNDLPAMREELGDLLLQVIFHAQIAADSPAYIDSPQSPPSIEGGVGGGVNPLRFTLGDCARELSEKLIRRHPHVFGDDKAADETEALASWHSAKKGEGAHTLDLDKVPRSMPALMRARKVQNKAAKVGFQWPDVSGAIEKVDEELAELKEAIAYPRLSRVGGNPSGAADRGGSVAAIEDELGDLLFAVVNVSRYLHVDPEIALIGTVEKFIRRFKHIEQRLAEEGLTLGEASLEVMDKFWDEAKGT